MSVSNLLPLHMAEKAAARVVEALSPACERITVAGSIRRRKDMVADIEIVAVARLERVTDTPPGEMFPVERIANRLHERTVEVAFGKVPGLGRPTEAKPHRRPPWGLKWRVLCVEYEPGKWMPVDLFIVERRSWGPQLAMRTGPRDFSQLLVTRRDQGGAMPRGMRMHDAELQHRVNQAKPEDDPAAWESLYLDEEPAFFAELGVPYLEPHLRSERALLSALGARR